MAEALGNILQALNTGLSVNMPEQILEFPEIPAPPGVDSEQIAGVLAPIIQSLDLSTKFDELNETLRQFIKDSKRPQPATSIPRFDVSPIVTAVENLEIAASFQINDMDDASIPAYYGSETVDGVWMIKKLDTTAGTVRYVRGQSGYATAWTNRAALTYDTYANVF